MVLDILMVIGIMTIAFYGAYAVVTTSKNFKPAYHCCDQATELYLMAKRMKRT